MSFTYIGCKSVVVEPTKSKTPLALYCKEQLCAKPS